MSMFCYQCQETAKNTGCTIKGVCGKNEEVAKLQDLLIYAVKGISEIVVKTKTDAAEINAINHEVLTSLFITITNANFDADAIEKQIVKVLGLRDQLAKDTAYNGNRDAAVFTVDSRESMLSKASQVGVLATENEEYGCLCRACIQHRKRGDIHLFHDVRGACSNS